MAMPGPTEWLKQIFPSFVSGAIGLHNYIFMNNAHPLVPIRKPVPKTFLIYMNKQKASVIYGAISVKCADCIAREKSCIYTGNAYNKRE